MLLFIIIGDYHHIAVDIFRVWLLHTLGNQKNALRGRIRERFWSVYRLQPILQDLNCPFLASKKTIFILFCKHYIHEIQIVSLCKIRPWIKTCQLKNCILFSNWFARDKICLRKCIIARKIRAKKSFLKRVFAHQMNIQDLLYTWQTSWHEKTLLGPSCSRLDNSS